MERKPKSSLNTENISQLFFTLFVISLFFDIKYTFITNSAYLLGIYSDFTAISLYISDILLILSLFFLIPRGKNIKIDKSVLLLSFWLILITFSHGIKKNSINYYFFLKFLEFIVAYGTAAYLFSNFSIKRVFYQLFVYLAAIQSLIALSQFHFQHSLGLRRVGEPVISPQMLGVAKIIVNNTAYIRGYGTFPHPNLLAAFLVTSILITIYLFCGAKSRLCKLSLGLVMFINILGLTVTFSRAGYLSLVIALVLCFGWSLWRIYSPNINFRSIFLSTQLGLAFWIIVLSMIFSFFLFKPFVLARTDTSNLSVDAAVNERGLYNRIGIAIIKTHPFIGVGVGESVLHMNQFSKVNLFPWQIQPIHNYFIIAAAELGIPGALILLYIFIFYIVRLIKNIQIAKAGELQNYILLLSILISFLILMQFDHYFYTLEQTQMLLWVFLGIIAAEIKNPYLNR